MVGRVGLTFDRVVLAAADLADEMGFENVTMSAVARCFGVSDASLYAHVDGVGALRVGVARLASGELGDRLAAALVDRVGKDALVAFALAYREFALRFPGRYMSLQGASSSVAGREPVEHWRVGEGEYVYAVLRAYGLVEPELTDAVRLLSSALHGFAALEAMGGFSDPRDVRASWRQALEALHVALVSMAAAAGRALPGSRGELPGRGG